MTIEPASETTYSCGHKQIRGGSLADPVAIYAEMAGLKSISKSTQECRQCAERNLVGSAINALGEYFVGLWIYKPFAEQKRMWTCTFRDIHGGYWESKVHATAEEALAEALDVITSQKRGESPKLVEYASGKEF